VCELLDWPVNEAVMAGTVAGSLGVYGSVGLAALAALLYLNSLRGGFVFDDHEAIESNVDVR